MQWVRYDRTVSESNLLKEVAALAYRYLLSQYYLCSELKNKERSHHLGVNKQEIRRFVALHLEVTVALIVGCVETHPTPLLGYYG
jgi:hypothetical protein